MMSDECPPIATLQKFVDGRLTTIDAEQIAAHLKGCARCRDAIDSSRIEAAEDQTAMSEGLTVDLSPLEKGEKKQVNNPPDPSQFVTIDGDPRHPEKTSDASPRHSTVAAIDADENPTLSQIDARDFHQDITGDEATPTLEQIQRIVADLPTNERPENLEALRPFMVEIPVQAPTQTRIDEAGTPVTRPDDHARKSDSSLLIGTRIGKYLITKLIGSGGFGTVYQARDTDLKRQVAIKIPHLNRVRSAVDRFMYLSEAQTLAQLDHPGIVPVFDFGSMSDGRCFVVSKFVDGKDLAHVLARKAMAAPKTIAMLISVADALQYVHESHLVHRDIKPGNLLVGSDGRVFVADFGLALPESRQMPASTLAGTPSYMSPEQARREGHRVDGRSDQFSLGVVMYEMLTGILPFTGSTKDEILKQIVTHTPLSLREINPQIPRELNRICFKLLSKLASQRYPTTRDLVEDLRQCLISLMETPAGTTVMSLAQPTDPDRQVNRTIEQFPVIPRGLRAFRSDDAEFFLSLLPGVRDRDNLPPVLGHWRAWVSPHDNPPELHRVGVISGPPGSGKSSLVRAGLLPILDPSVVSVFVEASADATERQLTTLIHRRCGDHIAGSLPDWISAIRLGKGLDADKTLLIVIDQFEQWLHAHPEPADSELVRAIRQCDGVRVQCLLLVRDDFWLALNNNALMVDLFDLPHARKVLIEFGRGYGRLPVNEAELSKDNEKFVDQALTHLERGGKVFPVHLALFAEMMKARIWVPATLNQIGGSVGIGAQFLNESFTATYAPMRQRTHEVAARQIMQALLPPLGTEIKASRRPRAELQRLSGYEDQPVEFASVMEILVTDLKLISAADRLDDSQAETEVAPNEQAAYQLSHDFLVPSIREWVSAKQRETYRGRLHQRITDQAGIWNQQRAARFLPSIWEWAQARTLLATSRLSVSERELLRASDLRSVVAIVSVMALALVLFAGYRDHRGSLWADGLVSQLQTAEWSEMPGLIKQFAAHERWAKPALGDAMKRTHTSFRERFSLAIAGLKWNPAGHEHVFNEVLSQPNDAESSEIVSVASVALEPFSAELKSRCWSILEDDQQPDQARFRSAQFLAKFDPPDTQDTMERWARSAQKISDQLILFSSNHPDQFEAISRSLKPAAKPLIPFLSKFVGTPTDDIKSHFATSLLSFYSADDPILKTRCFVDAAVWQRLIFASTARELSADGLWQVARGGLLPEPPLENAAKQYRRGFAAALLLALPDLEATNELWELLKHSPDETMRTAFIRETYRSGVPLKILFLRLIRETDTGVTSALLQAIGDYPTTDAALTPQNRDLVVTLFRNSSSADVHSSTEWLLRRWEDKPTLESLPSAPPQVLLGEVSLDKEWVFTPQQDVLVLVRARHDPKVKRDFFVATKEVTQCQFKKYKSDRWFHDVFGPTLDCPANVIKWLDAHAYCNWLSAEEGLPLYYPVDRLLDERWETDEFNLNKPGYRLPTAEEWEFACRANTTTDRFCGDGLRVLDQYAWHSKNSPKGIIDGHRAPISSRVGMLKPNGWGLFDTLGSVMEWTDTLQHEGRITPGGSVNYGEQQILPYSSGGTATTTQYNTLGFRVVRTVAAK